MSNNIENPDFNSLFWNTIGVNNRVFEISDIFSSKKTPTDDNERYKNLERDKQADEKAYDRYIKKADSQSLDTYVWIRSNEASIVEHLLRSIMGDSKKFHFYYEQIFNLISNYRLFTDSSFPDEMLIDLFAFQTAYLIENINYELHDVLLFEDSLQINSLQPFIDECKKVHHIKTNKDLASNMVYIHQQFAENMKKNKIFIPLITTGSLQTRLSEWKKNDTLPTLMHLITITNTLEKGNSEKKYAKFLQLLLIRALLHIESELANPCVVTKFLEKLSSFRGDIKACYNRNESTILQLQNKYLIDFSLILKYEDKLLEQNMQDFLKKNMYYFPQMSTIK